MHRNFKCVFLLSLMLLTLSYGGVAQAVSKDPLLERGRLVAIEADCAACHTNSKANGLPYAGGTAIASPLGVIYATNITPDKRTGIGRWTEAQFSSALREGKAPDHYLYPAMPYPDYASLSNADVHALYVYFMKGVQPVAQKNISDKLSFPFSVRGIMVVWNLLFNKGSASPDPWQGQTAIERGKYLVDAVAHCSTCHTPRNIMMASDKSKYLEGGEVGGWFAPDLTPNPGGLENWSQEEIITYLETGHVKEKAQAAGSMAEAVQASFRYMPRRDLVAIASYLKSLPKKDSNSKIAAEQGAMDDLPGDAWRGRAAKVRREAYEAELADPDAIQDKNNLGIVNGAILYNSACAACHQFGGTGDVQQYYPSLINNTVVRQKKPNNVIMVILNGIDRNGADGHVLMPAFAKDFNDAQVAAVANYVFVKFGPNSASNITPRLVSDLRNGSLRQVAWLKVIIFAPLSIIFISVFLFFISICRRRSRIVT